MKLPLSPPSFEETLKKLFESSENFGKIFSTGWISPDPNGVYYHWDKLRHLTPPNHLTSEEWWFTIKSARKTLYKTIPHQDKDGRPLVYAEPDSVRRLLHEIDIHGGGELKTSAPIANPHTKDTYLINSLIEESITSSQLEGAATTRKIAKEMLRQNRKPRDRSERMIVNNYHAMQFINEIATEDLTPELIYELHRILSDGTLDNPDAIGKLRTADDIYVGDERDATILHIPPKAAELPGRIESICNYANGKDRDTFLHPIIRAIVLHFMLAYDHPFEDGNGRTARALFYWSMLKQGYWTMEFISISSILRKAPAQYVRSYLYTETDDNDVTYFIVHQLQVIQKAIDELFKYLRNRTEEIQNIEMLVRKSSQLRNVLNHRQIAVINKALKDPDTVFYIESHRNSHDITYDTARTDLLKLVELEILDKHKQGKAFIFTPVVSLKSRLETIATQ